LHSFPRSLSSWSTDFQRLFSRAFLSLWLHSLTKMKTPSELFCSSEFANVVKGPRSQQTPVSCIYGVNISGFTQSWKGHGFWNLHSRSGKVMEIRKICFGRRKVVEFKIFPKLIFSWCLKSKEIWETCVKHQHVHPVGHFTCCFHQFPCQLSWNRIKSHGKVMEFSFPVSVWTLMILFQLVAFLKVTVTYSPGMSLTELTFFIVYIQDPWGCAQAKMQYSFVQVMWQIILYIL